jgi:hypothetical protein
VTLKTSLLSVLSVAALALLVSGCAAQTPAPAASSPAAVPPAAAIVEGACSDDEGITLVVDSSALADGSAKEWCRPTEEPLAVADVLGEAGVETEGTEEYGDQVVCRVNGLPSATEPVGSKEDPSYVEECASMPAAFAYWSLWTQPAGGEWAYAEEGLATLEAQPGERVALLFTLDGAPATPTS